VSALFFAASAALTIGWCASMEAMGGMPMPGGWTMSMTWMRMPGHSWPGSAASFLAMWTVMMVAMMLPSLVPMLLRYRASIGKARNALTAIAGAGYFLVWTAAGAAAFAVGAALAALAMREPAVSRAVPAAGAVIVVIAGSLQLTAWKSRHLARCREMGHTALAATALNAFRHGLHLGIRCVHSCANLTVILLVIGVMDLRAMAVVTAAITAERLVPYDARVGRATAAAVVMAGLILIVRG
jgi:predicted metal-binding membrane protein